MSGWFDMLHWQTPWWLLLLPLPLVSLLWKRKAQTHARLAQFIQRHLWGKVLSMPLQHSGRRQGIVFLTLWALLTLALAGPYLAREDKQQIERLAANIVVVLDISPSMGAQDVPPSRLAQAQKLLGDFSHSLEQHRLALIAFSANAYTVLPLSHDTGALRHFLQQMDPALAYYSGSNVSRALRLAATALAIDEKQSAGLVLLISDGEFHDQGAQTDAIALKQAGHKLITLGIGSEQGAPVPLAGGRLVRQGEEILTSRLNRATLQQLAAAGGGHYFDLRPDIWPVIESEIGKLQQTLYRSEIKQQNGQPLFPLLIGAALVLLIWQGIKRPAGLAMLIAISLNLNPPTADAAPWDEAKGLQQLQHNDNQGALETYARLDNYAGEMGKGAAAYRLGRWQEALSAFSRAYALAQNAQQQARAAYNQGNALTQLQELERASAAFELAIELQGNYPRASRNLLLVNKARQEWGGQKQREQQQPRPGLNLESEQAKSGAGAANDATPVAGQSEQGAASSQTDEDKNAQRQRRSATLSESLAQWSETGEPGGQAPLRAWQQYRNLKEDNQTMLQRRFEIEDKRVSGVVEEKPW